MKITSTLTVELDQHDRVKLRVVDTHDATDTIEISQGEHLVWIPRADIAEFCRVLTAWEAEQ